jgi:hypothetical protein
MHFVLFRFDFLACAGLWKLSCFVHSQTYVAAMPRKLVWIESLNVQGFGCSECNWVFKPSGALVGESLDEMYEIQRDRSLLPDRR